MKAESFHGTQVAHRAIRDTPDTLQSHRAVGVDFANESANTTGPVDIFKDHDTGSGGSSRSGDATVAGGLRDALDVLPEERGGQVCLANAA